MKTDNPFFEGKLTDRLRAISHYKKTQASLFRAASPEQFKADAEIYRQYFIDHNQLLHAVMEDILENAGELIREEVDDYPPTPDSEKPPTENPS